MSLRNKWTMGMLSLGAALVLGVSATAVYAQTATQEESADVETQRWDPMAALAEALGIGVEELEAAQDEVRDAAIDQAVEEGRLTQEQADLLKAREAFQEYWQERMQTEYEQAVEQAVEEGVLTQEQADLLLSQESRLGGWGFFGDRGMRGGWHGSGRLDGGPMGGPGGHFGRHGGMRNSVPALPESIIPEESNGTTVPPTTLSL